MATPSQPGTNRPLEMAHVLFMDIVAYSRLPMDEQHEVLKHLQEAVRETKEYARAKASDQLIRLPTGDGMALVFLGDVEAPVRCALELHRILRRCPEIHLRTGIHTGPVYRVEDINDARNVAGGGINIAQRVMDCGDAGHILISKTVADVLEQVSTWKPALHDIGEAEVKHGMRVHLYNVYTDEAGNRELPQKLRTAQTAAVTAQSQSKRRKLSLVALGAVGVIAAIVIALLWQSRHLASRLDAESSKAIAVLPFQNAGSDKATDFLRLALPDEIANTLSYVPSFSIRPFATTSKYNVPNVDLQKAGREMGVTSIVTGHYLTEDNQLEVTLEAVDVMNNRSVWRDRVSVAASDKIAMREQITSRVRQGLVPMLGGSSVSAEATTRPKNEEAYDLYLRSIAVPHEAAPNRDAIAMLERSVSIDPSYAPAWVALATRYYYDGDQFGGGKPVLKRSASATERALSLDPDFIDATAQLIVNRTEEGELGNAYAEAAALVKRRPESALAHFILSYVLRYAGLLDDAARECDAASKLDRRDDYQFRSCSYVFLEQGKSGRAIEYLNRDAGSAWSNAIRVSLLMREGKMPEAQQAAQQIIDNPAWMPNLLQACLNKAPGMEVHRLAERAENGLLSEPDPEDKYSQGAILAACGETQIAYVFLRKAIAENYCAHQALQSDPLLVKLRGSPEFDHLLSAAKECQDQFLAQRDQNPH